MCRPAKFLSAAAFAAAVLGGADASAAATCSVGALRMNLGVYIGDTSTPLDTISSMTVTCTRNGGAGTFPVEMAIGPSATSGSISNRTLLGASGTDPLAYNLYVDGGRLTAWGQTSGVDTVVRSISVPNKGSASTTFTIYGRIPGLQNVYPGLYSDTLPVTIIY